MANKPCGRQRLTKKAYKLLSENMRNNKFNNLVLTTKGFGKAGDVGRNAIGDLFNPDTEPGIRDAAVDTLFNIVRGEITDDDLNGEIPAKLFENRLDIISKMSQLAKAGEHRDSLLLLKGDSTLKGDAFVDQMIERSIAMKYIIDAIKSEAHTQENSTVDQATLNTINANGIPTPLVRILPTIGKAVIHAKGEVLTGPTMVSEASYAKLGRDIVESLIKDTGLVTINGDSTAVMGNVVDANGNLIKEGRKTGVSRTPTLVLNEEAFTDTVIPGTLATNKYSSQMLFEATSQLVRILEPYREIPVSTEADGEAHTSGRKTQATSTKEAVINMQKGAISMTSNPSLLAFFDFLHTEYQKGNGDAAFISQLKELFQTDSESDFLEEVFGIKPIDYDLYFDSNIGKRNAQVGPLIALMQHYSRDNVDKFYATYSQANNSRFFQREGPLNFQRNKKMDRHIMESAYKFNYNSTESITNLVTRLEEEYGLIADVITGEDTSNAELEAQLELAAEANHEAVSELFSRFANPSYKFGGKIKRPFEALKALNIINEIREGIQNTKYGEYTGDISTGILLESDASQSGPLIKLFQNIHIPEARTLLKRLGYMDLETGEAFGDVSDANPENIGSKLDDFYGIAVERLEALEKSTKSGGTNKIVSHVDSVAYVAKLMEIVGLKKDDYREFLKDPAIRLTYEQGSANNAKETATNLAEQVFSLGTNAIKDLVDAFEIKDTRLAKEDKADLVQVPNKKLNKAEQKELSPLIINAIQQKVTNFLMTDVLDPVYKDGGLNGMEADMNTLFTQFEKMGALPSDNGFTLMYMPADVVMEWVDANPDKDFNTEFPYLEHLDKRATGDKQKEVLTGNADSQLLTPLYMPNRASIHLMQTHSSDAAILIRAIAKAYEAMDAGDPVFKGLTPEDIVQLPIHDAIMMSPALASFIENAYQQEIMHVNNHYSQIDVLLMEVRYKASVLAHTKALETDPNAELELMSLEKLYDQNTDLQEVIDKANAARDLRKQYINVQEDGVTQRTSPDQPYKAAKTAFGPVINDESRATVSEGYNARLKAIAKHKRERDAKRDASVKSFVDTRTGKSVTVVPDIVVDAKPVTDLSRAFNEGALVLDIEGTGVDTQQYNVIAHQIAYSGPDGKVVEVNLPITDDLTITTGFAKFYIKHNDVKFPANATLTQRKEAVRAHINAKADKDPKKVIQDLAATLNGSQIITHNNSYDVPMLKKIFALHDGINEPSFKSYDSRDLAIVVERDSINEANRKAGEYKDPQFVANITRMEDLVPKYVKGQDVNADHTAAGDVDALRALIPAMLAQYRDYPLHSTAPVTQAQETSTVELAPDGRSYVLKEDNAIITDSTGLDAELATNPAAQSIANHVAEGDVAIAIAKAINENFKDEEGCK